jgi:hypothetical protein
MSIHTRIALTAALLVLTICNALAQQAPTQAPSGVSSQEDAACRSDAIRLCFFSIPSADNLKACLRRNKPDLSTSCRKLIESRGN